MINGVLVTPNWMSSRGAILEVREAKRIGIPIFLCVQDVVDWMNTP